MYPPYFEISSQFRYSKSLNLRLTHVSYSLFQVQSFLFYFIGNYLLYNYLLFFYPYLIPFSLLIDYLFCSMTLVLIWQSLQLMIQPQLMRRGVYISIDRLNINFSYSQGVSQRTDFCLWSSCMSRSIRLHSVQPNLIS